MAVNYREDDEWITGIAPDFVIDTVSKGECDFAGLPVNPTWELEEEFDHYVPSAELERWLAREQDPKRRKSREEDLDKTRAYEKACVEWELAFNAHLDFQAAKLFIALRGGDVPATGKKISNKLLSRLISDERKQRVKDDPFGSGGGKATRYAKGPNWEKVGRESIPADFWVSTNIEWQFSCSRGRETGFGLILIETDRAAESIPYPQIKACDPGITSGQFLRPSR